MNAEEQKQYRILLSDDGDKDEPRKRIEPFIGAPLTKADVEQWSKGIDISPTAPASRAAEPSGERTEV